MGNKLKGYVQEEVMSWSDRRAIMKTVDMTTEDDINGVCGNVFVACSTKPTGPPYARSYFLYLIDPTTGRKQFLVDMLPVFIDNRVGPGEVVHGEMNDLVLVTETRLSQTAASYDTSTWKLVLAAHYPWGDLYALEYVKGILYGVFYPEAPPEGYQDTDMAALVTVNISSTGHLHMNYILPTPPFNVRGLAYDRRNSVLWGSKGSRGSLTDELVTIDVGSGDVNPTNIRITDYQNRTIFLGTMEFGPDGQLYGIKSRGKLVKLSLTTGIARKVRDLGMEITGLSCFTL